MLNTMISYQLDQVGFYIPQSSIKPKRSEGGSGVEEGGAAVKSYFRFKKLWRAC